MSTTVVFGARNLPFASAAISALAPSLDVKFDASQNPVQVATVQFPDGSRVSGDAIVARHLVRISGNAALLGGSSPYLQTLAESWFEFSAVELLNQTIVTQFEAAVAKVDADLAKSGSGYLLGGTEATAADAVLWGTLKASKGWTSCSGPKGAEKWPKINAWWKNAETSSWAEKATELVEEARLKVKVSPVTNPPTSEAALYERIENYLRNGLKAVGATTLPARLEFAPPPSNNTDATFDTDYCFAVFEFAKTLKLKPDELAIKLAAALPGANPDEDFMLRLSSVGPYVNLTLKVQALVSASMGSLLANDKEAPNNRHLLVEFSSPNTNKPQHLGHVRNNLLGNATSNLLKWAGNKVTKVNLVNDRGIHICKSMLAYKLFGEGETPESSGIKGDHLVGKYYVVFENKFREEYKQWLESPQAKTRAEEWWKGPSGLKVKEKIRSAKDKASKIKDEAKKQEALAEFADEWEVFKAEYKEDFFNTESKLGAQAKDMLVKWEAADVEVRALWNLMNSWVFSGFYATYKTLGIEFDHEDRESLTYVLGKEIVQAGLEKGILHKEPNGAVACDLPSVGLPGMGKKILLRSDGTSVYMTQDLGTAYMRFDKFKPTGLVYVVANEQDDHFRILFKILGKVRPELDNMCHHLSYGMVNLPSGRMKSREGTVVDADDLVIKITEMCKKVIVEKWPELEEADANNRARVIGLAALKFYMLAFAPKSTVLFDPEKSLDFTGKTGPYMLYTYARARSVLRNAGIHDDNVASAFNAHHLAALGTDLERDLAQTLLAHRGAFRAAAELYEPSRCVDGIYYVARAFNSMYNNKFHKIVHCEDQNLRNARLMLVVAASTVIRQGLNLLGIDTLESM